MVVTRRKLKASSADTEMPTPGNGRSTRTQSSPHTADASARSVEWRLLLLIAGVVLLGIFQLQLSLRHRWEGVPEGLKDGSVVHLNEVTEPLQLAPLADQLPAGGNWEQRIFDAISAPLPNVGALTKLELPTTEGADTLTASQLRSIKPRAVVRSPSEFRSSLWFWGLVTLVAPFLIHAVWRRTNHRGDALMLPILSLLVGLGFLLMASVRDPLRDMLLFRPFAQGIAAGTVITLAASYLDFDRPVFRRAAGYALACAVLLAVLLISFGTGPGTSDAKINLLGFQPVELIKLLLVVFFAGYFAERWEFLRELNEGPERLSRLRLEKLNRWVQLPPLHYALPPLVAVAVMLGFFFLQRDLGPALILSLLFLTLYSAARGRSFSLLAGLSLLTAGVAAGYSLGIPRTVTGRIQMWLSPWDNTFRGGDHLAQSLWAMANGAISGTGLGRGSTGFVPEVHTDMVLSAIGEELGFIGLTLVFCLYGLLVQRGLRAAERARTSFSCFLAMGLTMVTALQILLIAGGVTGLFPLSGVVTPFLSYGRSALLVNFLTIGALIAISARPASTPQTSFRTGLRRFALVFALALSGILLKAGNVQVLHADQVTARGSRSLHADGMSRTRYNPRMLEVAGSITRGTIVDRNGIPLATSDSEELETHRDTFAQLGRSVDSGSGKRRYPLGSSTFHFLGDLNSKAQWSASNTSFVERDLRGTLQGFDDRATTKGQAGERDLSALIPLLRSPKKRERLVSEQDRTVRTTLDARLQARLSDSFAQHLSKLGKERGALVVLDARTGELLASVSHPQPNLGTAPSESAALDRARYGLYPPGSTFKLVTSIAALRSGEGNKRYSCGRLEDGRVGQKIRGWGHPVRDDQTHKSPHGEIGMSNAIATSCNAYFAQLATYAVGSQSLLDTASAFGIQTAAPNNADALGDSLPQAAYGQGQVVATPLEMAKVAATIASGGRLAETHWLARQTDRSTQLLEPSQAQGLARAMRKAVRGGKLASLSSIPIAGKTGTAQVEGERSHGWFIGFAPYRSGSTASSERTLAFSILVENGGYGSRAAAPMAAIIAKEAERLGLFDE